MSLSHSDELRMPGRLKPGLVFSLGLLSAAIIAYQLVLMQVLSIMQWYHFAYMVISIALLGFGAAGTVLSIWRQWLHKNINDLLPVLMISCGIAMALVTDISQWSFIRFDSYLLFANYSHIGRLLLTYLLFFSPFFLGALAIGLLFDNYINKIGKIYFVNLLGSGAGGLLPLLLFWEFFPNQLPAIIALLPVIAGSLIVPRKVWLYSFAAIGIAISIWKIILPPGLQLSQFKDFSKTMLLPDAQVSMEKASPYGHLQTVSSPVLRYAPGLSLTAHHAASAEAAVFVNGDWMGIIPSRRETDTSFILRYSSFALPYSMTERKNVLVLQAGTGIEVAHALSHRAQKITAVESNTTLLSYVTKPILTNSSISYRNQEPRTFLSVSTGPYDLICLPALGNFGGSAGLFALREQFLLTKESFLEMWKKLSEAGAISITAWMDYPARQPLKLLATMIEVLEEMKLRPQDHIAAIRSWATISFVMTKSALKETEINNIRVFCDQMQFDPAILPGLKPEERTSYHELQDSSFMLNMDKLFSSQRKELYEDYDFNIEPATDDRPYFSQFIRWKSLSRLSGYFGSRAVPFFEIGYLLMIVTLVQIAVISIVLILLPLFRRGWKGKNKFQTLLYFAGIGVGYMFIEMVFIQRFVLYFGNAVYSVSAVITSLLIFSGFGSYMSAHILAKRKRLFFIFSTIIVLLFIYAFALTPLLQLTTQAGLFLKLLVVFLLIAPLAFCMGIPFPAGLSQIALNNPQQVPWAWGINGCVSVISTALATIIAVEAGFSMVMLLAALVYCLPLVVAIRWK